MISTSSIRGLAGAVVVVSHDTRFGHLAALRVGLLLAVFRSLEAALALSAALALAAVALSLQGGLAMQRRQGAPLASFCCSSRRCICWRRGLGWAASSPCYC